MSRYEAGASGYPARPRRHAPPAYVEADQGRPPGSAARSRTQAWSAGTDLVSGDTYGDDTYYDEHDDELEEEPRRRGCAIALGVLAVLILGLAVAGWFGWSWVQGQIDPSGPPGEEVLVEVPDGTTTSGIGHVLADAGVITDARVWDWYTKVHDVGSFQAGTYRMRLNSSFDEAVDDLGARPLPPNSRLVTVPEGLTVTQLMQRLVDPTEGVPGFTPEGLQAALADPALRSAFLPPEQPALEGTLFPETYGVEEGETEAEFLHHMVTALDDTMNELDVAGRSAQLGITPYQALIVASMVEEEARVPEDRRQGGEGHLQPPGGGRAPRHRRHVVLREGRDPLHAHPVRAARPTRPTTPAPTPGCRRRRSPPRGGPASRPRSTRPTGPGAGTCWRAPTGTTPSPTTTTSSRR